MYTKIQTGVLASLLLIAFVACKKTDSNFSKNEYKDRVPLKVLNEKEKQTVAKFEHASLVLQGLFSANPDLRKEFNGFIAAKLAKSKTDEELTFKEIFEAKQVNLNGVKPDFLVRFRDAFATTFINGNYPKNNKYSNLKLSTIDDVARYFDIKSLSAYTPNSNQPLSSNDDAESIPYEIYFPYSENWDPQTLVNYAISYHPLTNVEWNYGMFFDASGNPLYEVTIDDDFAYGTPTYIITYDDGLKIEDFINGAPPIETTHYSIGLTDHDYNPIRFESTSITPNPSPCTARLTVKDGRWTLLRNGYGIFEGKIEFAVAVTLAVSEVSVPNQNPQSNPIILTNRSGHAWGYEKIKRRKIKNMQSNINEFVSFGLNVSPWCPGQPDKMLFLYEYDRPWLLSQNALEFSNLLAAGAGLIGDSTTRTAIASLASAGLAPLIRSLLEGTAQSRIEHYSLIGSNEVWANQRKPSLGNTPSLLNGFRPYGKNSVMVSLVID